MCFNFFFWCMALTRKLIQQVKYLSSFRGFWPLNNNLCGAYTFEKKEVIILGEKKIISDEISVIELTQMDRGRQFLNSKSVMIYIQMSLLPIKQQIYIFCIFDHLLDLCFKKQNGKVIFFFFFSLCLDSVLTFRILHQYMN